MNFIKTYNDFLNEGRGISNIIKEYVDVIYDEFYNGNDIVEGSLEDVELPLINFKVEFIKSDEFYGLNNPIESIIKNGIFLNLIIKIHYKEKDEVQIKQLLAHELNHAKEYYEIHKKMDKLQMIPSNSMIKYLKIKPTWLDISNVRKEMSDYNKYNIKSEYFNRLIFNVYLSLDTEMNARIAQLFPYLKSLNSNDINFLQDKIKHTKIYEFYLYLADFSSIDYINNMLNEIGEENLINITKIFNDKITFKDRVKLLSLLPNQINNISDVKKFYKTWENLFKVKSEKHLKKMMNLPNELSKIDENYTTADKFIQLYHVVNSDMMELEACSLEDARNISKKYEKSYIQCVGLYINHPFHITSDSLYELRLGMEYDGYIIDNKSYVVLHNKQMTIIDSNIDY